MAITLYLVAIAEAGFALIPKAEEAVVPGFLADGKSWSSPALAA